MPLLPTVLGAALLAASQSPQEAAEGGPVRLLVVPLAPQPEGRVEELYAALEAAGARGVDAEERAGVDLPADPARFTAAQVDDARAALLEARAALRRLEVEAVEQALERALALCLSLEAPEDHKELFADVLLLRAELALARGDAARAKADLSLLARLEPAREDLHPGVHPPGLVAAYAAARAENEGAPLGSLTLLPRAPGGAEPVAHLDGAAVPLGALRPPAGPHLVSLRAPGAVPRSQIVDVDPGHPRVLDPFLSPLEADRHRAALMARLQAAGPSEDDLLSLQALSGASALLLLDASGARAFSASSGLVPVAHAQGDALSLARAAVEALARPRAALPDLTEPPEAGTIGPALDPVWLAAGGGAVLVVAAAAAGALTLALWPAEPVPKPPRPIVIACCTSGTP